VVQSRSMVGREHGSGGQEDVVMAMVVVMGSDLRW
jgi:hypothetical protein